MSSDSEPEMFPYDPSADIDLVNPFNYQDPLSTPSLSRAISVGDIEQVKNLLKSGKKINNPDNNGNLPLHHAICSNKIEIVDILLDHSDADINYKNYGGFTPLLLSLLHHQNETIIVRLLQSGADIHTKNSLDETVLHVAVRFSITEITHQLIKRGADINAQDVNRYTPLTQAVQCNNLNAVCLLLYYNADVNISCLHKLTPLMYAVNNDNGYEVAQILLDYYDDFSSTTCDGYTPLLLAANSKNPLAIDLVKAGADVNFYTPDGCTSLYLSLYYDDIELFKEIWSRIDYKRILRYNTRFVGALFNNISFSKESWLECIYLILNSPHAEDIFCVPPYPVEQYNKTVISLYNLFRTFYSKQIELHDRLTILYIFLSIGYNVTLCDITLIYYLYGYEKEIDILINHYINVESSHPCIKSHPIPTFIFGLEKELSVKYIVSSIENQIRTMNFFTDRVTAEIMILKTFKFFSIPYLEKQCLINKMFAFNNDLLGKIQAIPEVPSLVEISRNKIRTYLKRVCNIKKPYQLHNIVKGLMVSQVVKDILIFKKSLY